MVLFNLRHQIGNDLMITIDSNPCYYTKKYCLFIEYSIKEQFLK